MRTRNTDNRGKDGNPQHYRIIDWLRFEFIHRLRCSIYWYHWEIVEDDLLMQTILGYGVGGGKKGRQYPDAILFYRKKRQDNRSCALIEVGNYQPDKWPEIVPVIHIGFSGNVNLINPLSGGDGIQLAGSVLREFLDIDKVRRGESTITESDLAFYMFR